MASNKCARSFLHVSFFSFRFQLLNFWNGEWARFADFDETNNTIRSARQNNFFCLCSIFLRHFFSWSNLASKLRTFCSVPKNLNLLRRLTHKLFLICPCEQNNFFILSPINLINSFV